MELFAVNDSAAHDNIYSRQGMGNPRPDGAQHLRGYGDHIHDGVGFYIVLPRRQYLNLQLLNQIARIVKALRYRQAVRFQLEAVSKPDLFHMKDSNLQRFAMHESHLLFQSIVVATTIRSELHIHTARERSYPGFQCLPGPGAYP